MKISIVRTIVLSIVVLFSLSLLATEFEQAGILNVSYVPKSGTSQRMPPVSNGPISATYNTTTELLQLIFRLDLGEGTISIRQNEEEIISEQMNFSEALQVSYSLSGCPSGEYEITVSATDGTFIGYLQKE